MIRLLFVAFVLICSNSYGADVPASEASIKELLVVTDVRKLVEGMFTQVDGMMKASMKQALGKSAPSAEEQKMTDKVCAKTALMMKEELDWDKLEPLYLSIYQKTFTQEEVNGLLAFYKSPAGVALVKKMPLVMQYTMAAMQERMGPLMQKTQKLVAEAVAEIEAEKSKKN